MLNNAKSLSGIHLEHATTVQSPNLFHQQPFLCLCRWLQYEALIGSITQVKLSGGWGGGCLGTTPPTCVQIYQLLMVEEFDSPKYEEAFAELYSNALEFFSPVNLPNGERKKISDFQHLQPSAFPTSTDRNRSKDQFLCFFVTICC